MGNNSDEDPGFKIIMCCLWDWLIHRELPPPLSFLSARRSEGLCSQISQGKKKRRKLSQTVSGQYEGGTQRSLRVGVGKVESWVKFSASQLTSLSAPLLPHIREAI